LNQPAAGSQDDNQNEYATGPCESDLVSLPVTLRSAKFGNYITPQVLGFMVYPFLITIFDALSILTYGENPVLN
jgi:hypothetical protein